MTATARRPGLSNSREGIRVGRIVGEGEVFIDIAMRRLHGGRETVEHDAIVDPLELSIMGEVRAGSQVVSCGQILDDVRRVTRFARGWTPARLERLCDMWEKWHLNGMKAECAHMETVWEEGRWGMRPSMTLTPPCPETGYRYGSAWLVKPLPNDVVDAAFWLIEHGRLP